MRFRDALPDAALLFGEDHGRVVATCAPDDEDQLRTMASRYGVPCERIGRVTDPGAPLDIETAAAALRLEAATLRDRYFGVIPQIMD